MTISWPLSDTLLGTSMRVAVRSLNATRTKRTFLVAAGLEPILQVFYLVGIAGLGQPAATRAVAVTASLLTAAAAAAVAMALTVDQARFDGVLATLMLSTRSAAEIWVGGTAAAAAVGLCNGLVSLTTAFIICGGGGLATFLGLAALVTVSAVASGGLGFAVGVVTLPLRSGLSWTVLVVGLMTVLGGVVAPADHLKTPVRELARALPLSHLTQAARTLLEHEGATGVVRPVGLGLAAGAIWFVAGAISWTLVVRSARSRGTFDLL